MSRALVSVASAPVLDLGEVRHIELSGDLTISEIIAEALPGYPVGSGNLRVLLKYRDDVAVMHPDYWHRTKPKPGVQVILRLTAEGDDTLRAVLTVVVSVAAMALGQFWAAAIVPTAGIAQTAVAGLITAGLTVAGTMLLNALIPIQTPKERKAPGDTYAINGWQNTARPGEPIPYLSGRMRVAPDFVGTPYTTVFGSDQYVTALLSFGYGPLEISDIKIGDTPLGEFEDVELHLREGLPGDERIAIYPKQVLEQREGVELTRPKIDGDFVDRPVVRQTAGNALEAALIFAFPAGMFSVNNDGDVNETRVSILIRQRLVGSTDWQEVIELDFEERKRKPFFRQYRWTFPQRGRWEIEVTKLTNDDNSADKAKDVTLAAIQSFRPEYPINFDKPLALLGIRIKASDQLSGALDQINAIAHRRSLDWTGTAWVPGLSRNPASAYRDALQGPQHPFPVPDDEIDLEQLEDWHAFCVEKGLKYDHLHAERQSLGEMLMAICAAGRATPRHDGVRWGVVIDRPSDLVVDHISPRNSNQFRWAQTYFEPPDAFRVAFIDETNDFELAERVVPWPGHEGAIDLVEELPLPGKTDPDEIWIEARRRQYELLHRATSYMAVQDAGARVATRGDTLLASYDVLDRTQIAARVVSVQGRIVELDEAVSMEAGQDYGLVFRAWGDENDPVGTSVVVPLVFVEGSRRAVTMASSDHVPRAGHLAHFGVLGRESRAVKVLGIEPGNGFAQVVHMVPAAPEIDELTDAEVPPAWNSAVGDPIDPSIILPERPVFAGISWLLSHTTGNPFTGPVTRFYDVSVALEPGATNAVALAGYDLEYRILPRTSWTVKFVPRSEGVFVIEDVEQLSEIRLRARAVALDGTRSHRTFTVTTGSTDNVSLAAELKPASVSVVGGLGHAVVTVSVADAATRSLQLYRVPAGG